MNKLKELITIIKNHIILNFRMNMVKNKERDIQKLEIQLRVQKQLYKQMLKSNLSWINKIEN